MAFFNVVNFFAAVAMFLFGVKLMGDGLESASKSKLKEVMNKLTKNKFSSVIAGVVLTMIIQFSSATTVMTVGMVNSGIINLSQAVGLILGANLGTTIKNQIIVFNPQFIVPFITIIGSFLFIFGKDKKKKDAAYIFMGFAIVVLALGLISSSVKGLNDTETFRRLLDTLGTNSIVAIILGIVFTVLFQSSSAIMVILIALSMKGAITLDLAFPIILGANIGTCSTAMISAFRTNDDAKRAALINLLINLIGSIIAFPLRTPILHIASLLAPSGNVEMQIANTHTIYNLFTVIIFYPFFTQLIKLSKLIIKNQKWMLN